MSRSVLWSVSDYAQATKTPKSTAFYRLKKEHDVAHREGHGGWFFRIGYKWQINMMALAAYKPGMLVGPDLSERVELLTERVERLEGKMERVGASMRAMGHTVERLSSRPPPPMP